MIKFTQKHLRGADIVVSPTHISNRFWAVPKTEVENAAIFDNEESVKQMYKCRTWGTIKDMSAVTNINTEQTYLKTNLLIDSLGGGSIISRAYCNGTKVAWIDDSFVNMFKLGTLLGSDPRCAFLDETRQIVIMPMNPKHNMSSIFRLLAD